MTPGEWKRNDTLVLLWLVLAVSVVTYGGSILMLEKAPFTVDNVVEAQK